jgi:hypothetical protein
MANILEYVTLTLESASGTVDLNLSSDKSTYNPNEEVSVLYYTVPTSYQNNVGLSSTTGSFISNSPYNTVSESNVILNGTETDESTPITLTTNYPISSINSLQVLAAIGGSTGFVVDSADPRKLIATNPAVKAVAVKISYTGSVGKAVLKVSSNPPEALIIEGAINA